MSPGESLLCQTRQKETSILLKLLLKQFYYVIKESNLPVLAPWKDTNVWKRFSMPRTLTSYILLCRIWWTACFHALVLMKVFWVNEIMNIPQNSNQRKVKNKNKDSTKHDTTMKRKRWKHEKMNMKHEKELLKKFMQPSG